MLQFDRSPDFFLRSKVYDNCSVFVAEEEGRIVGTAASAIKEFNLSGKKATGLYIFDVRVHPDSRGKGIAKQLTEHLMSQSTQAEIAYAIIEGENYPSQAVFEKLGFQNIRDILLLSLPVYKRKEFTRSQIRTMTTNDIPQVVNLINSRNQNRDLFSPLGTTDFVDKAERLFGYGLDRIQVAEIEGRIVACAGLWDYSQVWRITALRVSVRLRALGYLLRFVNIFKKTMQLPNVGEPFRLMYVRDFAYDGKMDVAENLVEHCLRVAYDCGCNFLSFPLDPEDPAITMLEKFRPIRGKYYIYAKNLAGKPLSKPATIYIDPADL